MSRLQQLYLNRTVQLVTVSVVALILGLLACKDRNRSANAAVAPVVPASEEQFRSDMQGILEDYVPTLHAKKKTDTSRYLSWHDVVKQFYAEQHYQPVWVSQNVLSDRGQVLYGLLRSAEYLGLNKTLYAPDALGRLHDSLQHMAPAVNYELAKQLEVGLTRAFFEMALHLDQGMFADTLTGIRANFHGPGARYVPLLRQVVNGLPADSALHSLEPQNPIYLRYMAALRNFVSKSNISGEPIHIRDPKTDSAGTYADARIALQTHHYLADSLRDNDSAFRAALLQFQSDNGLNTDGKIGTMTRQALERGDAAKFQLLAVNADRWRQEDINLPDRYVWVNLAAAKLRIIENDTMKMEKRVVIGKADKKHKTPTLESGINNIVLWPTWTVPQSIVKNEMKSFKGYKVTRIGNYTQVVQPPGPNNSLGVVKLQFPNKYSVYLHDTPSKYLFKSDYRAHSHGCVRCQDALELAAYLMQMDTFGISYDSLVAIKDAEIKTQNFRLKKPVPLYFKYFTAEADWTGQLHFYTDVYKKDTEMIDIIFGKRKTAETLSPAAPQKAKVKDSTPAWMLIPVVDPPELLTQKAPSDTALN